MKPFRLSRRALLLGAGAAIGLPVLDAMLDSRGLLFGRADAQTRTMPLRLMTFFFPGGCDLTNWHPTQVGPGYTPTESLMPLMGHANNITVLSGINLAINTGDGDGHARGIGCFATGAPITMTGSTGTSVDQVAQEELGAGKRSLNLALEGKPSGTFGGVTNTGDIYGEISWSVARGGVIEAVRDPNIVFTQLFGAGPIDDPNAVRARRYEQSILTYVRESTTRLQSRLGAADRQRLEAHLTAIRTLETQLAQTSTTCMSPGMPGVAAGPTDNNYSTAKLRQMMDLIAIAWACDISRFGSLMIGNGSNNNGPANHNIVGTELDEHSAAHDGSTPVSRYDQIRLFKTYHMTQLNYLLDKLASYTEPGGTVLDNSAIFVGSELADPVVHSHENLPILLCGKAGGHIVSGGSHLQFDNQPVGNVLLTALRAVGSAATSIGNSTGVLPNVLAS